MINLLHKLDTIQRQCPTMYNGKADSHATCKVEKLRMLNGFTKKQYTLCYNVTSIFTTKATKINKVYNNCE